MKYGRLLIFILCTLASGYAVLLSSVLLFTIDHDTPAWMSSMGSLGTFVHYLSIAWVYISAYAWIVYFSMGWFWSRDEILNKRYLHSGYIAGLIAAGYIIFIFKPAIIIALQAILLACYLLIYHSKSITNASNA